MMQVWVFTGKIQKSLNVTGVRGPLYRAAEDCFAFRPLEDNSKPMWYTDDEDLNVLLLFEKRENAMNFSSRFRDLYPTALPNRWEELHEINFITGNHLEQMRLLYLNSSMMIVIKLIVIGMKWIPLICAPARCVIIIISPVIAM